MAGGKSSGDFAAAQRSKLVWAEVRQSVKITLDIKNTNLTIAHFDDSMGAFRKIVEPSDDKFTGWIVHR
jgi:hypothetical protein